MKLSKLTALSKKNINTLFENYAKEIEYKMDTTFIKALFQLVNIKIDHDAFITKFDNPQVNSPYMAKEIELYLKKNKFHHYSTRYNINTTIVNVNLYSMKPIQAKRYLYFIKLVLSICVTAARDKHKEINIKIALTPIQKTYPSVPVEPSHINSAHSDIKKNEIMIFRKEEWFKVLIHECFHLFHLDFCESTIDLTRLFKPLYHVDSEFLLFEALTEFMARTMNLSILSFYTKENITYEEFEEMMKINIQVERIYCISHMNHMLGKIDYSYKDLIHFNKPILKENTNFFCYYVLPSVLFFYYNDTMKWLLQNKSFLQFSNNKIYPFFYYIKEKYNTLELLRLIERLNKPLYGCNMSVFEIVF